MGLREEIEAALAGGDPVAAEPGPIGSGRGPEAPTRPAQLRPFDDARLDLV